MATLRALPTLLRVGFADAVAYRAELVVWVLSTTMPLIMLALWSAVARDAPVGRFGQREFTAYFLAAFIVRQITGSWAAWQMNHEIRHGTLALRLLRPVHPMLTFAVENVGVLPLRVAVSAPAAAVGLAVVGPGLLPRGGSAWFLWGASMVGSWLLGFLISFAIGSLAFYLESSVMVMEVWQTLFLVLSGYLIPIELFPPFARAAVDWLPFRYQMGLPVELLTSAHGPAEALSLVLRQWFFVALVGLVAGALWRGGTRRFAAHGG